MEYLPQCVDFFEGRLLGVQISGCAGRLVVLIVLRIAANLDRKRDEEWAYMVIITDKLEVASIAEAQPTFISNSIRSGSCKPFTLRRT